MVFRIVIVGIAFYITGCYSSDYSIYNKAALCNVQERINRGCMREVHRIGMLRCLDECLNHNSCIGASIQQSTGKCYIHQTCSISTVCNTPDPNFVHYSHSNVCALGQWDQDTGICHCPFATFGDNCDKAHKRCEDLLTAGYSPGEYTVYLDPKQDGNFYKVICYAHPGYGIIFTLYNRGGIDFNRTWVEYVNGFSTESMDNFWIGLKAWHVFSTISSCDRMFYVLKLTPPGNVVYHYYTNFIVDENYTYTFHRHGDNFRGNIPLNVSAQDCFGGQENTPFSTWDKSSGPKNCASQSGSGWWHLPDCDDPCNLLGWGIDDWDNTPTQQRLAIRGISDIGAIASQIAGVFMYIEC